MVQIRGTYEASGHADIGCAIPCAKAPPAPNFQEGLAQGSVALTHYPEICCVADPPPAPTFLIERATGAPLRCHDRHEPHFTMLRLLPKSALN